MTKEQEAIIQVIFIQDAPMTAAMLAEELGTYPATIKRRIDALGRGFKYGEEGSYWKLKKFKIRYGKRGPLAVGYDMVAV